MTDQSTPSLVYDPSGVFLPETGISRQELADFGPWLSRARTEVYDDLVLWYDYLKKKKDDPSHTLPEYKVPLDAAFMDLPERLLAEYEDDEKESLVGRVLATADAWLEAQIDRVVVLGIGGSYMGARALFEALGHPYHNELPREERGGLPRIYFEGNNVDNSTAVALLDMLKADAETPWAAVVLSKSGGTLETAVGFRLFLNLLREQAKESGADVRDLVAAVTGQQGRLRDLVRALGVRHDFVFPEGVGGRYSVLTAVGLLPAAIMGVDIVELLEGAAAMNRRFFESPPGDNPVLDYVGVCHLMEAQRGATIRVLSTWGKRLEAVGLWYDQLLAESLGKCEHGATPLTVVNTRDLHSRGQQHQEGRRDKLITNLYEELPPEEGVLAVGRSDLDQDRLNALADTTLPQILDAAIQGTNQAYRDALRPTADIRLPRIDEHSLGQLFQMLMLATVVEGRLIGINPYGQPGVEAYKKNMNAILRGEQPTERDLQWPPSLPG